MQKPIAHLSLEDEGSNAILTVPIFRCRKIAVFEEEFGVCYGAHHAIATNKVIATIHAAHLSTVGGCAVHCPVALFAGTVSCHVAGVLVHASLTIPVHPCVGDKDGSYACETFNGVV